ncbi:hypothetical protein V2J09_019327 [Rumex salicifolius]
MARQVPPSRAIAALILFSSLLCKLVSSDSSMMTTCMSSYNETVNNRTGIVNDKYKVNLETLLNSLPSASASTSLRFYNTTAGKPPYKSYGIYLCRGDTTSKLCRSCVTNLTGFVISNTANCTESIAYSDSCMLRFANYSFLGRADDRASGYMFDNFNANFSLDYNRTLGSVVEQVTRDAAYNSASLFATSEATVDGHEKVYALAQCTPDVDRGGCSGCLKTARSHLRKIHVTGTSGDAKTAWVMLASCQLRYDNVSFFGGSPASSPPISAVQVATLTLFNCLSNYTETTNAIIGRGLINEIYQVNLQSLFIDIASASASVFPGYYNTSAGEPPNKAYGMYFCLLTTSELCHTCVTSLINTLDAKKCKVQGAETDDCMIHYAYYSPWTIFEELQAYDIYQFNKLDKYTGTISQAYNQTLEDTVEQIALSREAADSESTKLSDIFEALVKDHGKIVYVLAAT